MKLLCVGEKIGLELIDYFIIKVWGIKSFKYGRSFKNGKKGLNIWNI